jgi:hypothetical protein
MEVGLQDGKDLDQIFLLVLELLLARFHFGDYRFHNICDLCVESLDASLFILGVVVHGGYNLNISFNFGFIFLDQFSVFLQELDFLFSETLFEFDHQISYFRIKKLTFDVIQILEVEGDLALLVIFDSIPWLLLLFELAFIRLSWLLDGLSPHQVIDTILQLRADLRRLLA